MSAKEIFEKLVQRAGGFWATSSMRRKPVGKPGELVEKLAPEEREELQNLTSEDVKEADRGTLMYMMGMYPESTVTVHTHTIKKDDDES
jgi:hypothetical protein